MKGLRLYLPPFAPDDSGAAVIFRNLNAMTVIIDAGGCAGNILSFDETQETVENATFSAGLRDMDAILGRDENLIEKITAALNYLSPNLIALVGTPVPAVIGTDYNALCRIIEKKHRIPAIAIDTDGTKLYDEGVSKTYLALFKKFAQKSEEKINALGILGATHFDFCDSVLQDLFKRYSMGYDKIFIYGYDGNFESFKNAGKVAKNIVISASGLEAAEYLYKNFNIPYEIGYSSINIKSILHEKLYSQKSPKLLIVHEQFNANALRGELKKLLPASSVTVGTWFLSHKKYCEANDVCFADEEDFIKFARNEDFDAIVGDKLFLRALPFYEKDFIPFHHFAVSGSEE